MKNYIIKIIRLMFALALVGGISFTEAKAAEQYTYTITPLTNGVCYYFYVKTEDPDPTSFRFVDEASVYASGASDDAPQPTNIVWDKTEYLDVNYLDKKTLRVNGGYLFYSGNTDGGKLRLEKKEKGGKFVPTGQTVTIPQLRKVTDYLIATYTTDSMSFFEKMDAVQKGYYSLCRYSDVSVDAGVYFRDPSTPYDAIMTMPYADNLPCYQFGAYYFHLGSNKPILLSSAYPFFGTSIGFPSQMKAVAKRLEPSCLCEWDDYTHYIIHVTFNGETKPYGGQGNGTGQIITADQILYQYSFDGTVDDAYTKNSWEEMNSMLRNYEAIPAPEAETNPSELTWEKIEKTIETGINYARVKAYTNYSPGQDSDDYRYGYTCFYKDDNGDATYFSNEWFEGRYYNKFEFFEKGTTWKDKSASTANIVLENVKISIPKDDKKYLYKGSDIYSVSGYDADTGIWKGLMTYKYDKKSGNWISDIYSQFGYEDENGNSHLIEEPEFKDAMTLTLDEIKTMNIDRNANIDPVSYYNYDGTVPPGTKVN